MLNNLQKVIWEHLETEFKGYKIYFMTSSLMISMGRKNGKTYSLNSPINQSINYKGIQINVKICKVATFTIVFEIENIREVLKKLNGGRCYECEANTRNH